MDYAGHKGARANDAPFLLADERFDRTPELSVPECSALALLDRTFEAGSPIWPPGAREAISRLTMPLRTTLDWLRTPKSTQYAIIHLLVREMHRRDRAYWGWSSDEWIETLCADFPSFRLRHGPGGKCRQDVLAIAYLLCGFDRLAEIGRFLRYHLAVKVFGRAAVDRATSRILSEMAGIGYTVAHQDYGVAQALHDAFLIQRSAQLDAITPETLRIVASSSQLLIRRAAATLSRTLMRLGIIRSAPDDHGRSGRRPSSGYRASEGVQPEWLDYCNRWRATSTSAETTREQVYYRILKCGRWLAAKHPEVATPGDLSRAVAIEYVAAVDRMTIGEWANPNANYVQPLGKPLKPRAKASHLSAMRHFIRDLQEWEWIPRRFDPARALALPRSVRVLIGPAPRIVADDHWAKLVWAGMNLTAADVQAVAPGASRAPGAYYPIEMVRALAHLWLFGALRSDEIHRLPVGCIRWLQDDSSETGCVRTCLLDVPINKTATAFTKPVDAILGEAVEVWQRIRRPHPKMLDEKTGAMVDFLFVHRGSRVARDYLNRSLIPMLCAKAGIPLADARGRITSHRGRATIASQLCNSKEPLTLFELQTWLGHASPASTQHYAAVTPTKLSGAVQRAGYFQRNLRTIEVLVDQDAIRSGSAASGEPWRFYDLGHGLCTYDFFDQCPHRMACVKCSFYIPKESARAQALEAKVNLARMLREIPLLDEERAAVEDGMEAMTKLASSLRDIATPDGRTPAEIAAVVFPGVDASTPGKTEPER
ncbi:MAG: tyrosine-type recombinase/integrase [Alphaproteobacteria bacterium]